jgi:hypothetical protein
LVTTTVTSSASWELKNILYKLGIKAARARSNDEITANMLMNLERKMFMYTVPRNINSTHMVGISKLLKDSE